MVASGGGVVKSAVVRCDDNVATIISMISADGVP
jgi:hypothetical protein